LSPGAAADTGSGSAELDMTVSNRDLLRPQTDSTPQIQRVQARARRARAAGGAWWWAGGGAAATTTPRGAQTTRGGGTRADPFVPIAGRSSLLM
jgi:hypothetical protein